MNSPITISFLFLLFFFVGCKKESANNEPFLPNGTSPYANSELAFVPYNGSDKQFKKAPAFTQTLTLQFKERITPADFYAWDQTFFTFNTDPGLVLELRFRYLQAENESLKTLAIYMPHRNDAGKLNSTIFEMPIDPTGLEAGFFADIINFHESINLFDTYWENVYEVSPISTPTPQNDGPTRFVKVYYNTQYGILALDQKNGDQWVLTP